MFLFGRRRRGCCGCGCGCGCLFHVLLTIAVMLILALLIAGEANPQTFERMIRH